MDRSNGGGRYEEIKAVIFIPFFSCGDLLRRKLHALILFGLEMIGFLCC